MARIVLHGRGPTLPNGGFGQARGEWLLRAACHNLRTLHGHVDTAGLAGLAVS
ncbi:hypothetical protein [Mycobacterium sp.]|uniref:hypothetical protein n=1 Tax=Mycobacterium sp. TaxID=1785 RepID=UPI0025F24AB3|nr:hypothetical protein [Mycobacterium sp.]